MKLFKNKKGITLVELLAVLVILGIIAAIAVPSVTTLLRNTQNRANVASANSYADSARLFALSDGGNGSVAVDQLGVDGQLFFFNDDVLIPANNIKFDFTGGVITGLTVDPSSPITDGLYVSNEVEPTGNQRVRVFLNLSTLRFTDEEPASVTSGTITFND